MAELESENRRMREPLEAAKKEMEELRRKLENYEKDKALLAVRFSLVVFSLSITSCAFRVPNIDSRRVKLTSRTLNGSTKFCFNASKSYVVRSLEARHMLFVL